MNAQVSPAKTRHARLVAKLRNAPFEEFAKRCFKIKPKEGKVVPFELNDAQKYIHAEIEDQLARTGKVRKVLLKGRQQGGSTYVGARYYKKVTEKKGITAFILSHESRTTKKLFEMVQRYHDHLPQMLRPTLTEDSQSVMSFGKLDSGYEVGTARNKETGRGLTSQLFHGSEVAFWPWADEILAGVLQSLPNAPGTEIILESTANGAGGKFYEYVQDAREGNGEFELIFVPWYWQSEYTAPVPDDFERDEEELLLCRQIQNHPDGEEFNFELSDGQLQWRRNKIYELKSLDKFKQEYPCHIEEAFLFSGRPVFNPNHTEEARQQCYEPQFVGDISIVNGSLTERSDGFLKIWDLPDPNEDYALGGDVAEGLEHGDFSSLDVLDSWGQQVASYHGHIDPDLLGHVVFQLGKFYNFAYAGVERNNHGHSTLSTLKNLNYPNLHVQEKIDEKTNKKTTKLGWHTNTASKPFIIDNLAALLRDEASGVRNKEHVKEMQTYVYDEKGASNACPGCYDDRVMSYAIAHEMVRIMPRTPVGEQKVERVQRNWRLS